MTVYKIREIGIGVSESVFIARAKKLSVRQVRNWAERIGREDHACYKVQVRLSAGYVEYYTQNYVGI